MSFRERSKLLEQAKNDVMASYDDNGYPGYAREEMLRRAQANALIVIADALDDIATNGIYTAEVQR